MKKQIILAIGVIFACSRIDAAKLLPMETKPNRPIPITPLVQLKTKHKTDLQTHGTQIGDSSVNLQVNYYINKKQEHKQKNLLEGSTEEVQAPLLQTRLEENAKTKQTPQFRLRNAILADSPEAINQIIESIVMEKASGQKPFLILLKAILSDKTEEIKSALQTLFNKGLDRRAPLLFAVLLKKSKAIETLLEYGVKIDASILWAVVKNVIDPAIAYIVVKNTEDEILSPYIDAFMKIAVKYSIQSSSSATEKYFALELIQEIINRGYDVNKVWSLIELPYSFRNELNIDAMITLFELLVKNGADPDYVFEQEINPGDSWTPLMAATLYGNERIIEALLNLGADINKSANPYSNHPDASMQGFHTPFYYAMELCPDNITDFLKHNGGNI